MSTQAGAVTGSVGAKRPFGFRDRFGYMFGDFGNDFTFILQMLFFMVFYTKFVGIEPAHVGLLMGVARIVDAFTDVGMGRIADTSKGTAAGKFRPWILRGAIPVAVASALMYQSFIAGWDSYGARVGWMAVTYLIWGSITYTMINIPYGSMASVISDVPENRAQLSVWRSTGAQLAVLFLSVVLPLVVYTRVNGVATIDGPMMTWAAIVCSVLAILCYVLCYALVTERVPVPAKAAGERMGLGSLLGSLFSSRPLIGLVLAALLLLVGNFLISQTLAYIVLDYFGDGALQSRASMAAMIPPFALIVLAPWLAAKFGKRETGAVSMFVVGLILVGMNFMDLRGNITLFIIMYALTQFGIAIFNFLVWAFVIDVIDAQEVRTGERNDATTYAVYSWARKLGQALSSIIGGFALTAIGYQTAKGGQVVTQTEETLQGLWMVFTLLPGILMICVALVLQFVYPLSKRRVAENVQTLRERRAAAGIAEPTN